jgi:hypothetical protein
MRAQFASGPGASASPVPGPGIFLAPTGYYPSPLSPAYRGSPGYPSPAPPVYSPTGVPLALASPGSAGYPRSPTFPTGAPVPVSAPSPAAPMFPRPFVVPSPPPTVYPVPLLSAYDQVIRMRPDDERILSFGRSAASPGTISVTFRDAQGRLLTADVPLSWKGRFLLPDERASGSIVGAQPLPAPTHRTSLFVSSALSGDVSGATAGASSGLLDVERARATELRARLAEVERKIVDQERLKGELAQHVQLLAKKLAESGASTEQLAAIQSQAASAVGSLAGELSLATAERERLRTQIAEIETKLGMCTTESASLQGTVAGLRTDLATKKAEAEAAEHKSVALSRDLQAKEEEYKQLLVAAQTEYLQLVSAESKASFVARAQTLAEKIRSHAAELIEAKRKADAEVVRLGGAVAACEGKISAAVVELNAKLEEIKVAGEKYQKEAADQTAQFQARYQALEKTFQELPPDKKEAVLQMAKELYAWHQASMERLGTEARRVAAVQSQVSQTLLTLRTPGSPPIPASTTPSVGVAATTPSPAPVPAASTMASTTTAASAVSGSVPAAPTLEVSAGVAPVPVAPPITTPSAPSPAPAAVPAPAPAPAPAPTPAPTPAPAPEPAPAAPPPEAPPPEAPPTGAVTGGAGPVAPPLDAPPFEAPPLIEEAPPVVPPPAKTAGTGAGASTAGSAGGAKPAGKAPAEVAPKTFSEATLAVAGDLKLSEEEQKRLAECQDAKCVVGVLGPTRTLGETQYRSICQSVYPVPPGLSLFDEAKAKSKLTGCNNVFIPPKPRQAGDTAGTTATRPSAGASGKGPAKAPAKTAFEVLQAAAAGRAPQLASETSVDEEPWDPDAPAGPTAPAPAKVARATPGEVEKGLRDVFSQLYGADSAAYKSAMQSYIDLQKGNTVRPTGHRFATYSDTAHMWTSTSDPSKVAPPSGELKCAGSALAVPAVGCVIPLVKPAPTQPPALSPAAAQALWAWAHPPG